MYISRAANSILKYLLKSIRNTKKKLTPGIQSCSGPVMKAAERFRHVQGAMGVGKD